jgi:hypothetical protein
MLKLLLKKIFPKTGGQMQYLEMPRLSSGSLAKSAIKMGFLMTWRITWQTLRKTLRSAAAEEPCASVILPLEKMLFAQWFVCIGKN